jgi:hypothetical protein
MTPSIIALLASMLGLLSIFAWRGRRG